MLLGVAAPPERAALPVRDELVRAAVYAFYDTDPKEVSDDVWRRDAQAVVRVHRLAPLVEHAYELQQAILSLDVLAALVAERHAYLLHQLQEARRDATLAWARVAVLEEAA